MASAKGTAARNGNNEFMERMHALHPEALTFLPAGLGHAWDKPSGGQLAKGEARNLEPANKRAASPADFATIYHPGGAGISRQLRQAHIIFLRLQLST